jgi:hypothetical protein
MPTFVKIRRPLCTALCAALLISGLGPNTAQAIAAVIRSAPIKTPVRSAPLAPALGTANLRSLTLSSPLNITLSPTLKTPTLAHPAIAQGISPALTAVAPKLSDAQAQRAVLKQFPVATASQVSGRALARPTARQTLNRGAKQIKKAAAPAGRYNALKALFTGGTKRRGLGAVFASKDSGDVEPTPGLERLSIATLERTAVNSKADLKERQGAVDAIAHWTDETAAKAALLRIAKANPNGGSQDYEVHRAALKFVAEKFNDPRSLRPVSPEHAAEIIESLRNDKPEMLFSDYDDTLAPFNTEISPEAAAAFESAADAGVETVILTDRPDFAKREGQITIVDSLAPLTVAQRQKLTLVASRGTRRLFFDRRGSAQLVEEVEITWSAEERTAITEVGALVKEKYGIGEYDGRSEELSNYGYAYFLPLGMEIGQVKEAASYFTDELARRGVDYPVAGRTTRKPETDPPYLSLTKIDKSIGVVPLRAGLRRMEQMRDLLRFGLPRGLARAAWKALAFTGKRHVPATKTLLLGDQFFDTRTSDTGLIKGAPGALAISVGGAADPRLENVFVWPTEGAEGSTEILTAIGHKAKSDMNKKAVVGLFAQRTVSIAAFLLTAIAYPFVAVPAVGWAGYGALMAIGPIAAIATGPLNGLIVDRLSARNAMSLNTVVRAVLALVLPAFAALGILNFWTLVIASVANGWLLSSIMTTEGAYVKRLAGVKNISIVNNLLLINYFMLQVVLALLLGIGSVVDTMGPLIPFYISAAAHALLVLPIIWFTMPNISPSPRSLLMIMRRLERTRARIKKASGDKLIRLREEEAKLVDLVQERRTSLNKTLTDNAAAVSDIEARIIELEKTQHEDKGEAAEAQATLKHLRTEISLLQKESAKAERELSLEPGSLARTMRNAGKWLRKNWLQVALLAGSVAAYVFIEAQSGLRVTLPIIGALMAWIASLDMFKALWSGRGSTPSPEQKDLEAQLADNLAKLKKNPTDAAELKRENKSLRKGIGRWRTRLRNAMLFMALSALMLYPLQYIGLPNIAEQVMGAEGKGLFLGNLLGALFFGNMISNAAKARMPNVRLPFVGRVAGESLLKLLVLGLAATWMYTGLFPGSFLAAAGAVVGAAAVMAVGRRLTERGWLKLFGVGYMAIWLPYLAWATNILPFGVGPAALIAALIIGLFNGPAYVAITSYFHRNAAQGNMGKMVGVQGSFFNAAVSTGYGLMALGVALLTPAFPPLLAVLGVFYVLGGLLMWRAPDILPGLPKTFLHPKKDKK